MDHSPSSHKVLCCTVCHRSIFGPRRVNLQVRPSSETEGSLLHKRGSEGPLQRPGGTGLQMCSVRSTRRPFHFQQRVQRPWVRESDANESSGRFGRGGGLRWTANPDNGTQQQQNPSPGVGVSFPVETRVYHFRKVTLSHRSEKSMEIWFRARSISRNYWRIPGWTGAFRRWISVNSTGQRHPFRTLFSGIWLWMELLGEFDLALSRGPRKHSPWVLSGRGGIRSVSLLRPSLRPRGKGEPTPGFG